MRVLAASFNDPGRLASLTALSTVTALVQQADKPTPGTGVFELEGEGNNFIPSNFWICPVGSGANNATFDLELWGWRPLWDLNYWQPFLVYKFASVTLGNITFGAAVSGVTWRLADTLPAPSSGYGQDNVDVVRNSPGGDTAACAVLDTKGFRVWQVRASSNGNLLWGRV